MALDGVFYNFSERETLSLLRGPMPVGEAGEQQSGAPVVYVLWKGPFFDVFGVSFAKRLISCEFQIGWS